MSDYTIFYNLRGRQSTVTHRRATLSEFDDNDRFFTASCDPYVGHTLRLVYTFHQKKGHKGWLFLKMPEV
jgi:hypothetical protein